MFVIYEFCVYSLPAQMFYLLKSCIFLVYLHNVSNFLSVVLVPKKVCVLLAELR